MYRQTPTRDALLSLQNNHGLDTNLLLFCCWYAHTRGRLNHATVRQALTLSEPWAKQVVRPLRAARSWMKLNGEMVEMAFRHQELREQIKALELQAEHLQEDMLESIVHTSKPVLSCLQPSEHQAAAAVHNLVSLLKASSVPLNPAMAELLALLITTVLGVEEGKIEGDTLLNACEPPPSA